MKVEILAIGTELLMGQIANTNAQYLSRKLPELGLGVYYHSVVGDNPERLKDALKIASARADIIITTGGLGPTQDDLSKETISEFMGKKMIKDDYSANIIVEYFKKTGKPMAENNIKQAYFPENCIIMKNALGTAPGFISEYEFDGEKKSILVFPGPPRELIPMYENEAIPYLSKFCDKKITSAFVKIVGIPESMIEKMLGDIIEKQTNPSIAMYASRSVVTLRISAFGDDSLIEKTLVDIRKIFGENIISEDNKGPAEVLVSLLKSRKETVCTGESITAGLISGEITSVSGASEVIHESFVTYSNEAKSTLLGVKCETLSEYGAVSKETAREMALGLYERTRNNLAIAVTGNAGPDAMDEKPVGRVYIGICYNGTVNVKEYTFAGNREAIRIRTTINALNDARLAMLNADKTSGNQ